VALSGMRSLVSFFLGATSCIQEDYIALFPFELLSPPCPSHLATARNRASAKLPLSVL
jgi:hypothetical protein